MKKTGADVETRQEIFEQLLPEETFVDRRLMTEALGIKWCTSGFESFLMNERISAKKLL